jgi:hypothetical protein
VPIFALNVKFGPRFTPWPEFNVTNTCIFIFFYSYFYNPQADEQVK